MSKRGRPPLGTIPQRLEAVKLEFEYLCLELVEAIRTGNVSDEQLDSISARQIGIMFKLDSIENMQRG